VLFDSAVRLGRFFLAQVTGKRAKHLAALVPKSGYADLGTHSRIAEHRNAEARPGRLVIGHPDSELTTTSPVALVICPSASGT